MGQTRACSKSVLDGKIRPVTPVKHSLRNEKLKANRLKNMRKERLRIRREKETQDHKNQCLAILKRLYRGDENELKRKLRLETANRRLSKVWRRW